MVLHITLSREKSINDKSPVMFVLSTVYWPPGHHTDFIKEFVDFLSELVLAADKVLIVGDFNIHVDNEKDTLGSAFIDILNSIGVRQHMSGPTHCRNHTLDLILSHGIDVNGVEILQQSNDISDHYLVLCRVGYRLVFFRYRCQIDTFKTVPVPKRCLNRYLLYIYTVYIYIHTHTHTYCIWN